MTCAFFPSGQSVACGSLDTVCSIFSLSSPTDNDGNTPVSRLLSGHKGCVSSWEYVLDDDNLLITRSGDHMCLVGYYYRNQNLSLEANFSQDTLCRCFEIVFLMHRSAFPIFMYPPPVGRRMLK